MDITTLFKLSSGLYVIGAKDDDRNVGCVVNTVVQSTAKPVTLTVCINKDNFTNTCIKNTNAFSVSILSEKIQQSTIGTFGFSSSRDKNKFDGVATGFTPGGLPYLKEGVTGFIQCKVINFVDIHTHTIFIAEVQEAQNISDEPPMTYEYYHKVIKGKAPKNASAYVEEKVMEKGIYKCTVCGYEYDGAKEEFEALGDDYQCPLCGAAKDMFELM